MSEQNARLPFFFQGIFRWLMIFVGVYWISAVALMVGWPWSKETKWAEDLPLVAVCANQKPCGIVYGELEKMKAEGKIVSLTPKEPYGEIQEETAWTKWASPSNEAWQYEVKRSSWYFESKTRYRLEGDKPVLVQSRDVGGQALIFALPVAAFFVLGLRLRSLRGK